MTEAVRVAAEGDAPVMVMLQAAAREELTAQRGGPERLAEVDAVSEDGWATRLVDERWIVLIATCEALPFGYLAGSLVDDVLQVEAVWVEPEARELGLGDQLLETAMTMAVERGAGAIEAVALPGDRATKNLYERFGIKARAIVVRRSLG